MLNVAGRITSGGAGVDVFDTLIENLDDVERLATAYNAQVVIPRRSRFLISDVTRLQPLLADLPVCGYDCIVMDPPWENKSAKRSKHYPTLPSRHLLSIPIKRLLNQEYGLLALWVTNRERLRRCVEQELLPHWGLEEVATWFWLKVTDSGQLVSPLEVAHRRPYESLVLARPRSTASNSNAAGGEQRGQIPNMVFLAMPGQHSRKPHLGRLLKRHLPPQPACLEMFARELAAGWTSWGNEALRFQTTDCFMKCEPAKSS
ncbi:g11795 [Coccomyxa elongata]